MGGFLSIRGLAYAAIAIPRIALSALRSIFRMLSPDRPNRAPRSFSGVASRAVNAAPR